MGDFCVTVPRAAIVIPIFNVEDYLAECLDSVVEQSVFDELQVVLVEDGSSDRSQEIAEEYVSRHPNMQLIVPPHGGLGAARNNGMREVTAPFVGFLDSDDVLPPDAYEKILAPLEADPELDVSIGDMRSFPKVTQFFWGRAFAKGARQLDSVAEVPELIHSASACNKLFRVDTLRRRGDRFPEGVHFEDAWVIVPYLLEAKSIAIVDGVVYLYRKREVKGSIMDSLFTRPQNYWDYLLLVEHLRGKADGYMAAERALVHAFIVRGFQGFLSRADSHMDAADLAEFYERAYRAVSGMSPRSIVRNVVDVPHKVTFGRLLLRGASGEFSPAEGDGPRLGIAGSVPHLGSVDLGPADEILCSKGFSVSLEGVSRRRGSLVLEGRITARGIPIDRKPDIEMSLGLGRRRFPAEWLQRPDRPASDGSWSAFRAVVPLARWPRGEYFPRLHLETPEGSADPRMMKTVALFRNVRPIEHEGSAYRVGTNDKNQVCVRKSPASRSAARRSFATALGDLRDRSGFGRLRLLARVLRKLENKPTWLIGERWDTAQDNGAALFKHLAADERAGVRPVYVIERNSPEFASMSRAGKVVAHGSWRHKLELCRASLLISAFDVDTYILPRDWGKVEFLEHFHYPLGGRRVFLGHGVSYRTSRIGSLHRLMLGYDLVVASSVGERDFFAKELSYGRRAVSTGLPRFDTLTRMRSDRRRMILFAPTWRQGLVVPSYRSMGAAEDRGEFMASQYFRTVRSILESPRVAEFLEDAGAELRFLPHYEAAEFFTQNISFTDRVKMADLREHSFQEWLRLCDAYVTDFSSSFFDVAFMRTPIVYLDDPNDPDADLERSGSFFDAETDGFGPIVEGEDGLVNALARIAENGFEMEPEYHERVEVFFEGVPLGSSTKSVVEAIKAI